MIKSKTFVLFSLLIFLFTFPLFSEDSENGEETIVFIESAKKTEYKKIEEDDELLSDEEDSSLGIKIITGIVMITIIVILLLKSCIK